MRLVRVKPHVYHDSIVVQARVGRWPWNWKDVAEIYVGADSETFEDLLATAVSKAQTAAMATKVWT